MQFTIHQNLFVHYFLTFSFNFKFGCLLEEETSVGNVGERKKTFTIKIVRKIIYPTPDNSRSAGAKANQQHHEIPHKPNKGTRNNNNFSNEKSNQTI